MDEKYKLHLLKGKVRGLKGSTMKRVLREERGKAEADTCSGKVETFCILRP